MVDFDDARRAATTAEEVRRRLASEVALPSRLGHTALLLAGCAVAAVAVSLLLTEAGLPLRTRLAFGGIAVAGLAWAVFAGWVLLRRRVLFALHSVVAARMAVAFSGAFTVGALLVGVDSGAAAAILAAATGAVMLVVALVLHDRARRRVRELERRRDELELRLADGASSH